MSTKFLTVEAPKNVVEDFKLKFYELEQDDLARISRWIEYAARCQDFILASDQIPSLLEANLNIGAHSHFIIKGKSPRTRLVE
ncbi:hypothetical protein CCACVL1_20570 [Corchorus capsularis]|uniref:Uncharacterized protein n=1 Tax=Corchorus capsularis TaxID=210143 RepID=A0A1R3HAL4_COCAP|nr:hypothetical protein CCACVL1_20570 [Corchorus capsularis]